MKESKLTAYQYATLLEIATILKEGSTVPKSCFRKSTIRKLLEYKLISIVNYPNPSSLTCVYIEPTQEGLFLLPKEFHDLELFGCGS